MFFISWKSRFTRLAGAGAMPDNQVRLLFDSCGVLESASSSADLGIAGMDREALKIFLESGKQ
ncbi:MAG: hypothetical protein IIC23_11550 [Chloroflexi bacterium]|nr:hypothetical protein [Chloroflexota bacterium]